MIISFSGTGNSFWVAYLLEKYMGKQPFIKIQGDILCRPEFKLESRDEKSILWVFPTYSWGIPPVVKSFIDKCKLVDSNIIHHLIVTCGDDTGDLYKQWSRLLKNKNWNKGGIWSVQMPNTYVLMKGFDTDSILLEKEKLERCEGRIKEIADSIKSGKNNLDIVTGKWKWVKTSLIYPWFIRHEMSPKPFHASDKCISCGLCEQQCPTQNIKMLPTNDVSARPTWGKNCALCLRCYHHCPAKAIEYGNKTKNKGQYKIVSHLGHREFFFRIFNVRGEDTECR